MVLRVELDGRAQVLLGALEVLHVERLDRALLELERLLLPLRERASITSCSSCFVQRTYVALSFSSSCVGEGGGA